MQFVSLADFHKRLLLPGEPLSMYVHQLKQLLNQAMPDIPAAAKEQLLLHQFLSGLPQEVSKQLRATGTATTLTDAVERAKLLMTIEHCEVAATTKQPEFLQLQQQLSDLSEQVAAISFHTLGKYQGRGEVRRCFICNKTGHLQHAFQQSLSPQAVTVATIKNKATVIMGEVGNASVEIMFDSGSAVSLLRKGAYEIFAACG